MIYLSHYLSSNTPGYAGSTNDIIIKKNSCINHGDSSNSLRIELKNHVGTHIDLPRHFDPKGKFLNDYPASFWFFDSVQLIDLPCDDGHIITIKDLEGKIKSNTDCVLIRTGFENKRQTEAYWSKNPGVDKDVGQYLRTYFPKLRVFGFDFISLTSFTNRPLGREAHKGFLGPYENKEPVLILEDMKLSQLRGHPEKLVIAPLMVDEADGGPVTVIAFP